MQRHPLRTSLFCLSPLLLFMSLFLSFLFFIGKGGEGHPRRKGCSAWLNSVSGGPVESSRATVGVVAQ